MSPIKDILRCVFELRPQTRHADRVIAADVRLENFILYLRVENSVRSAHDGRLRRSGVQAGSKSRHMHAVRDVRVAILRFLRPSLIARHDGGVEIIELKKITFRSCVGLRRAKTEVLAHAASQAFLPTYPMSHTIMEQWHVAMKQKYDTEYLLFQY
jgi:hypothetical protein